MLLDEIVGVATPFTGYHTVLDLFSGTSRVGHAFKKAGYSVTANDHNAYAHTLGTCYVQADKELYFESAISVIDELKNIEPKPGYFTETFCINARFFQPHNGAKIDAIRDRIEELDLEPVLKAVVLTSLIEAADRVDSTTGVQMAYLKQWAPRSFNDLELRIPHLLPASPHGPCQAVCMEAKAAAEELESDIAYLDPPYNQHSYLGNYHIWESLVRWDKPEVYGIARKRIDCRERPSVFNSRPKFSDSFQTLLNTLRAKLIIVSFSNEGFIKREELEAMLIPLGKVEVFQRDYKRYVGAQIGIHNPSGERVGKVSHLNNKEFLYVCDRS